jgi:hypothetical protein
MARFPRSIVAPVTEQDRRDAEARALAVKLAESYVMGFERGEKIIATAAAVIAAGKKRRGELAGRDPIDAHGKPLDPKSLAAQIVMAARKRRGEI